MGKDIETVTLTAYVGANRDLIPKIMEMYVPRGSRVADVTFGKGAFWKDCDLAAYEFTGTDLVTGTDFRDLPYADGEIDCLILDPPYMHGGSSIKESINKCYRNNNASHESVIRLYAAGIIEAARVLKKGGTIIVKTQDEIESGRQRLSHCEIIGLLEVLGFVVLDLFVLVQRTLPAMRSAYQKSARKNHSYAIVAKLRR
jgi:hypothetical protein